MIGEKILGYTVDEKIGSDGLGIVYKVLKTNVSGTYVRALKHITIPSQKQYANVLNSMGGDYLKVDDYFAGVLKEIVNEIQIISTLSEMGTPNIVKYYENNIVESESPKRYDIYILMEWLTPFTDYIYHNELMVSEVIRLGKDILTALVSCHAQNVIHSDIKDDDIFVLSDGTYKLGNFGVSKMLKNRSRTKSVKETCDYVAPEVYLGKEHYDVATVDIYSLGMVLYKLLNKSRNPFLPEFPQTYNSDDEDIAFKRRMKGETPQLPFDARNLLGEKIIKAISNREARYNSAQEFLEALIDAEKNLPVEEMEKVINKVISQSQKDGGETAKLLMDETIEIGLDSSFRDKKGSFSEISKETVKKRDCRWLSFVLPIVIFTIYVILYLIIIPDIYGNEISLEKWLFNNPEIIVEVFQNKNTEVIPIYKIWALKIFVYLLWMGFIASLFNLGRTIQNKKPEYNVNAALRDKDAYLKAMKIYEEVKGTNCREANAAKIEVRNVMEHLYNESAFGVGNDSVIACEHDIACYLNEIEDNIQALYDDKNAKQAGDVVVANCKKIQAKLRIRTEMKKK